MFVIVLMIDNNCVVRNDYLIIIRADIRNIQNYEPFPKRDHL